MNSLVWRGGVVSAAGIGLLAAIGAAGRAPSTFEEPVPVAGEEAHIRAYAEPLRAIAALHSNSSREEVRPALDTWLTEYRKGVLFSVPPTYLDDLAEKGARAEILRGRKKLSSRVYGIAYHLEKEDPHESARWYGDLLALNDIFKFSNPETISDGCYYQHAAMRGLERLKPSLSKAEIERAREQVAPLLRPAEPLGPFTLRINMAYRRYQEEPVDNSRLITSAITDISGASTEIVEAKSLKTMSASQEQSLKMIGTTMYMALRSEQRTRESADEFLAQFAK